MPPTTLDVAFRESHPDGESQLVDDNLLESTTTKIVPVTAVALSDELGAHESKIRLYAAELKEMGHPCFRMRKKRSPFNSEQAATIRQMRQLRMQGIVGDAMISILLRTAKPFDTQLDQLEHFCTTLDIRPEKIARLIPFVRILIQSTF